MINQSQLREAHMRIIYLGLVLNLLMPIVIVVAGYFIRQTMNSGGQSWGAAPDTVRILFWALLAVALSEVGVTLFLRKTLLQPNMRPAETSDPQTDIPHVQSRYIVLFALALSPAFYGLVLYLLGGEFREFVLFAVISLVIYRLVRPGQDFFYALFGARPGGVEE